MDGWSVPLPRPILHVKDRITTPFAVPEIGWVAAASRSEAEVLRGIHKALLLEAAVVACVALLGWGAKERRTSAGWHSSVRCPVIEVNAGEDQAERSEDQHQEGCSRAQAAGRLDALPPRTFETVKSLRHNVLDSLR
jgi:hypothetical protein